MNSLASIANKAGMTLRKHSPEILIVTGVVGVVASTVLACRATKKVDDILEEHEELIERAREEESPEDVKKNTTMVYIHTATSLAKLYAPAVVLGVVSLGCIISSNQILRKRNIALAGAYAALDKGYKEYRQRVVDRFGEEVENQIFYNLKSEEIEETVTDEKGKEKTVKKKVDVADPLLSNPNVRYFTRSNSLWKNDMDYNLTKIKMIESWVNDKKTARGHGGWATWNEALAELCMAENKEGIKMGWPEGTYAQLKPTICHIPNEYGELEEAIAIEFVGMVDLYEAL